MPGPQALEIELSATEGEELEQLVRRHSTAQQQALRARIVLGAAAGKSNSQIAREEGVNLATVRMWRSRWKGLQVIALADLSVAERLEDAPRSGRPPEMTPEQVCQISALGCEKPSASARPISQWSGREIAAEIVKRGILESISARHARRLLKRGAYSRPAFASG